MVLRGAELLTLIMTAWMQYFMHPVPLLQREQIYVYRVVVLL